MVIFGTNDLFVARETDSNIIASADVLWRYMAAFLFAAIGMITVAALAFMLSVFADNSIGPIVATVCVIIVFTILTQLQIPFYDETVKPWLFTTHMLGWKGFFYVKGDEGVTINGSLENFTAIVKSGLRKENNLPGNALALATSHSHYYLPGTCSIQGSRFCSFQK